MANLDPRVKQLAGTVMDDSLAGQRRGGATGGGMDSYMDPSIGKTSIMDKVMGGTALGGGILSAILKNRKQRAPMGQPPMFPEGEF
jgi:hypothetical protein